MHPTRWERLQSVFHQVVDLPPAMQRAALDDACGGDEDLKTGVMELLAGDDRTSSFIDGDLAHAAHQLFDSFSPSSDQFGPYRIIEMIKEGGMGVVYLAERSDVGQRVAIKMLRDAWVSPARRARFAIEQRMLARLNHRSIARLYDADTLADGTPFFVMDYVEGLPITEYCRRAGCTIDERLGLFRDICEAVQHAHRHLIVHRDLKPSNILVTGEGVVKLLDFGIAKEIASLGASADQTQFCRMMTPQYAAPEQLRGEAVGVYTDVYSLGIILYELLTGRLPFDAASRTGAADAGQGSEPVKPSLIARSVDRGRSLSKSAWADLDVMCGSAMHNDLGRRYPTVEALLRDVDHYQSGRPLDARVDSWRYRTGKFVRRHAAAVLASAAMAALVAALIGFYTFRLTAARNDAMAEAARSQRVQDFMLRLFDAGENDAAPAADLKVVTLVDRGVQEARSLAHEPAIQAELYQTLGTVYEGLGQYERADELLNSALEERRHLGSDADVADSLVALGLLRLAEAKLGDAERLVREGLEKGTRRLPKEHPTIAKATAALGKVLEVQGAYDRAIPTLQEAARLYSGPGDPTPELAAVLTELANAHFYAGHLDESESLNQRVLQMDRRLRGDRHPNVADDLLNLGAIQSSRARYADAERYDREALEIFRAWYSEDHPETASAKTILASALMFQESYDEAASLLRGALATQERVYGASHPRVAFALNELGNVALRRKDFDDAETAFTRALTINRGVYPQGKHFRVGVALSNLAGVYLAREEYPRAEQMFREAVDLLSETQSPDHMNTGIAQIKLGRTLVREGRFTEAESPLAAGYRTLRKQSSPSSTWLRAAREDLARVYEALKQPENARHYRDELAAMAHESKP